MRKSDIRMVIMRELAEIMEKGVFSDPKGINLLKRFYGSLN